MEKKWYVIIGLVSLIIILALIIFFNRDVSYSPYQKTNFNLSSCNSLYYNANAKTNIVFFSGKDDAKKYADYLRGFWPYSKNKNGFNFYYIDGYNVNCEMYKGIALLCYSRDVVRAASSCPNDYIIVLKTDKPEIRSSSYMNVLSLNTNLPESVVLHEFAHAFASLADEYVPANLISGSKNCALKCSDFNQEQCYQGCSDADHYRSVENGIMRSLSSREYGSFDSNIILSKIGTANNGQITGNVVADGAIDCAGSQYYLFEGFYSGGEIKINSRSLEVGCVDSSGEGGFSYQIELKSGAILNGGKFNPEFIYTDAQQNGESEISGEVYDSDKPFELKIPVVENAKTLKITKDNNVLLTVSLDEEDRPCQI